MPNIDENITFDDVINPANYQEGQGQQLVDDVVERSNRNYEIAQQALDANLQQMQAVFASGLQEQQESEIYAHNKHSEISHDENASTIIERNPEPELPPTVDTDTEANTDELEDEDNENIKKRLQAMADINEIACNELGVIHYFDNNIDQAVEYFEKSSDMGYPVAKRNLAIALENNNSTQTEKIFSLYSEAAEKGDIIALNNLGCCYLSGDGVEEDVKKAIKCFEEAAQQGDELAKINLADCYAIGNGVRRNLNKAYKLYNDAAELGNPIALKRLAECYLNGQGVTQNFRNALECYHKAALKGDEDAQKMFDKLAEKASPNKHSIDERIADAKARADERNDENNQRDKNRQEPVL